MWFDNTPEKPSPLHDYGNTPLALSQISMLIHSLSFWWTSLGLSCIGVGIYEVTKDALVFSEILSPFFEQCL